MTAEGLGRLDGPEAEDAPEGDGAIDLGGRNLDRYVLEHVLRIAGAAAHPEPQPARDRAMIRL
jgi:hypothetical protein